MGGICSGGSTRGFCVAHEADNHSVARIDHLASGTTLQRSLVGKVPCPTASDAKAVVAREYDRLRARPHAELVEQIRGVIANCLLADGKALGNVGVAESSRDQRQHL